ncbi:DUF6543 domain-containing protein [Candidatus Rhabdochlamydia sp. T3358]|uniref:dermonecrotic toxin domain-containing protein n=1 Tax=Candidatus Rhabdochlamydia sp. T3358 TaxID=2099795 RepID=UPI0010B48BD9|nr:DUF6543 domain-containing protein [Candidatus Rhabdochlamydia sp. T3358]VHO03852.1 hypothetical protein RHT_01072 [Candidatus Rhabdochlamydia sp. T3358]
MKAADKPTIETKLSQIPAAFRLLAKNELQEKINENNPSLNLDPDKIYIKNASGSSETLTDALLKKAIGEENLLNTQNAWFYSTENVRLEDIVQGLDIARVKTLIEGLSAALVNTYYWQMDNYWKSNILPIPQELKIAPEEDLLKTLVEKEFLIERAYQIDSMYPNLKQSVVSYLSQKLKSLYNKDINPDIVRVLIFKKGQEDISLPSSSFDLTNFALNYLSAWFFYLFIHSSEETTIWVKIDQTSQKIALNDIFQTSDALAIKSKHQVRLNRFWQKNTNNYRILAKFSYLKALLEQQNSELKLSEKSLKLALQAIGLNKKKIEAIINIDEIDPKEISLDILETLTSPKKHLEVSLLLINNQIASDILKICDPETTDSLLYIPGYSPSFIEASNEKILNHWVFFQVKLSPKHLAAIASHFPHSSRVIYNTKQDAFLHQNYRAQENVAPIFIQEDIFSFITKKQKERIVADLYTEGIPVPIYSGSVPNFQSTDSAFFTTIAAAIKYLPQLLPNIHNVSGDLQELFPSPYETAAELVKKGIKNKLNIDIDPDKTFISFSLHEVESFSYDPNIPLVRGQEASTTIQSLTEAALSNYQEGYSPLGFTTIIYQDLSGKREYTANAELLNILPKDVEDIIQKADLAALHKSKLDSFWNQHTNRIKYFCQHRYLQQALEDYQDKILSEENFKLIVDVVFYSLSLEEEELPSLINPHISIEIVSVDSYQSTDMFVFRDTSKEQVILYISGDQKAFFPFANYEACICFLEEKGKTNAEWQKLLTSHFSMDVQDSVLSALKRGPYIDPSSLTSALYPRSASCSFSNTNVRHPITTKPIEKSFFEVIQKNTQKRSYLDASAVIVSDRELMLRRVISIAKSIEIALLVPSLAFPILNWVSLAALATETSINLYLAKNADTIKERHLAALSAGFNTLELLLIGAFLSLRSLKFSKEQSLPTTEQVNSRTISSGRGLHTFLKKNPISEELFFDTTKSMQVWQISAGNHQFSYLDAKAWLLDEQFLLFTGKTSKARHLIISSHGGYFPGSSIVKVPNTTELVILGPHGWELMDTKITSIAKRSIFPYGVINEHTAFPSQNAFLHSPLFYHPPTKVQRYPKKANIKALAGTNVQGHIKNYTLTKYQKFGPGKESYLDVVQLVNRSRNTLPIIEEIGLEPIDVLTIRNRIGKIPPNLDDLFKSLQNHGIHYNRITLAFCRSNTILSGLNSAPKYTPPMI